MLEVIAGHQVEGQQVGSESGSSSGQIAELETQMWRVWMLCTLSYKLIKMGDYRA